MTHFLLRPELFDFFLHPYHRFRDSLEGTPYFQRRNCLELAHSNGRRLRSSLYLKSTRHKLRNREIPSSGQSMATNLVLPLRHQQFCPCR